MMKVCERFPQLGRIVDYMALPQGERAIYEQYTLDAIEAEARTPVLRFDVRGGGQR
jgi:hypothetical protein